MQAFDLLTPQRRLKGEIEVVELFDDGQTAGAHRSLQAPVIAQLRLRGEQLLDRLGRRQRAAVDALEDGIERFEGAWHPEVREDVPEPIASGQGGALHATPPVSCA